MISDVRFGLGLSSLFLEWIYIIAAKVEVMLVFSRLSFGGPAADRRHHDDTWTRCDAAHTWTHARKWRRRSIGGGGTSWRVFRYVAGGGRESGREGRFERLGKAGKRRFGNFGRSVKGFKIVNNVKKILG